MKRNRLVIIICAMVFSLALISVISIAFVAVYYKENVNVEYDEKLFGDEIGASSTAFYANGSYGGDEYVPVKIDLQGASRKIYYELDEISDYLIDGFIAVEDRGFYNHSGVDLKRTALAAIRYICGDKKTFGASTITQQLIKNISGDKEVTIRRKLSEILRAYSIEKNHTKSEIIEVYLNVIPMGNGIVGVGAASEIYFGKSPSDLTPSEAATLIGITNAPSAYDPYRCYEKCLQKRNRILNIMYSEGVIDYDDMIESTSLPLGVIEDGGRGIDSWYIETVISDISRDYASKMKISESLARMLILSEGYSIYTTVDLRIQEILENAFSDIDSLSPEIKNGLNYSMIVIEPKSGNILGVIGGAGEKSANRILNRATTLITPASALKPIALYAPLIDSSEISWSTVFDDSPVEFKESSDGYSEYPHNSPNKYDGLITVKDALRYSKNTVAVRMCKMRGVDNVYKTLTEDYEFDTIVDSKVKESGTVMTDKAVAPMALGQLTNGISLRALTEAYTVFPNYGTKVKSRSYLYMLDKYGGVVLKNDIKEKQVFSDTTGKIMNQLLSEVVKSGTAKAIDIGEDIAVAGKTGTAGNNKEKVFVGYTPSLVSGIWCGYDDKRSMGKTTPSHLDVWSKVMNEIEVKCGFDQGKRFNTDGLVYTSYCMDSGKKYSHNCIYDPRGCRMEYGYFSPNDNSFMQECDTHIIVNYDTENKGVAIICDEDKEYAKVSLIKITTRSFPKEVYITDAEYVYRDVSLKEISPTDKSNLPYFYNTLQDGEFVGISDKRIQFNRLALPKEKSE